MIERIALKEALQNLPPRNVQVIAMILAGYTQQEIAADLGCNQSTVCRIIRASSCRLSQILA